MAQALMEKQVVHGFLSALAALFILAGTPAFAADVRDVTAAPAVLEQVGYYHHCWHRVMDMPGAVLGLGLERER